MRVVILSILVSLHWVAQSSLIVDHLPHLRRNGPAHSLHAHLRHRTPGQLGWQDEHSTHHTAARSSHYSNKGHTVTVRVKHMIETHQVDDKWWRQIEIGCAGLMTESRKFVGDSAVTCVVLSPYEADRVESGRLTS